MTPLEYIQSNPSYEEARNKFLAFTPANKTSMLAKQNNINTSHRIAPVELTDGRWAVCCDVVTEIDGGVFSKLFKQLDKGKLDEAEIIERSEFESLRPEPEPV